MDTPANASVPYAVIGMGRKFSKNLSYGLSQEKSGLAYRLITRRRYF